jgi:molybdenum cofactor biosynthesis enzyme MoaA
LLDISITDRCFSNCSFCYRGSNKDGNFAASEKIKKLIDGAKALGVFEIVFGGGEPTLHPDFPKILEYTHEKGIAANFTTNNLDWTKDVNTLYKIIRNTSSITISVHSLKDLLEKKNILEASHKSLEALRKQNEQVYYHEFECFYKIIFQIVVDLVPDAELKEIVEYTSKNRTLLSMVGFKNTGRAKNLLPEKKKNLREMILAAYSDYESPDGLSVDTCFLKEYPEFVQKLTCNLKEGWESFFIDATNEYFAISSFSKELKKINMNVKPLELEDEMHGFFKNLEPK